MDRTNKIKLLQLLQAGMSVEQAEIIANLSNLVLIDRNGIITGCFNEPVTMDQVEIMSKFIDVRIIKPRVYEQGGYIPEMKQDHEL